jgi:hypothetical protein
LKGRGGLHLHVGDFFAWLLGFDPFVSNTPLDKPDNIASDHIPDSLCLDVCVLLNEPLVGLKIHGEFFFIVL